VLAGALLVAGFYTVRPSEQAIVLRFGAPQPLPKLPGIHWRIPFVDRVVRAEVTKTYTMPVGFRLADEVQRRESLPGESQWLTGDTNILSVRLSIQYQIADPAAYLLGSRFPPELLRRASEAAVTEALGSMEVDDALTTGRLALVDAVRKRAQSTLDQCQSGLRIASVAIRAVEPPDAVRAAFQDVQNARSDRERLINEATGSANESLPRARGEAQTMVQDAINVALRRTAKAGGDTDRFDAVRKEAERAPATFRQRAYLEAMERILPRMRLYVIEGQPGQTRLRLIDGVLSPAAAAPTPVPPE